MEDLAEPLRGVRVIDMADEKGELCGRLLADLGADVIRVEPPAGSVSRRMPPLLPDGGGSLYFIHRNTNKRGITLDIGTATGRELLRGLLARADIWIESYRPGYLCSLGLDPEEVRSQYPQLIVTSITDFGQTGPYRDYAGTDALGFAMGGMMFRSGLPDRPPLVAPGALAYDCTAVTAAFATIMAYWQRTRDGQGQWLDVSVMESVGNLADWSLPSYSHTGNYNHRAGSGPVYPLYPCKDGWVRLIILAKRQWRAMRDWLGEPPALQDEVWDKMMFRIANRDVLDPILIDFFKDKTRMELTYEAQKRGIPLTPVLTLREVMESEHSRERGTFVTTEVSPGLTGTLPSGFFSLNGKRYGFRRRAPLLGEHNNEVYGAELGLAPSELETLRSEGVI